MIVKQDYNLYTASEQSTWRTLMQRQYDLIKKEKISKVYVDGFEKLGFDKEAIMNIETVSEQLRSVSGWTLIPVNGFISNRDFFFMLKERRFPINITIRKEEELEFSILPDIFHDLCGHLPLLTNEKFTRFLTAYSTIALKYVDNERALELLGRLYWFTYEVGVIEESGVYRPYGGAIITSSEEIDNVQNDAIPKHKFDLGHIFSSAYIPFHLQKEYFAIRSFDDLFNTPEKIESVLLEQLAAPGIAVK